MINIWTRYIQHPRPGVGGLLSSSSILPQYNKCDSHDTAIIMVPIIHTLAVGLLLVSQVALSSEAYLGLTIVSWCRTQWVGASTRCISIHCQSILVQCWQRYQKSVYLSIATSFHLSPLQTWFIRAWTGGRYPFIMEETHRKYGT